MSMDLARVDLSSGGLSERMHTLKDGSCKKKAEFMSLASKEPFLGERSIRIQNFVQKVIDSIRSLGIGEVEPSHIFNAAPLGITVSRIGEDKKKFSSMGRCPEECLVPEAKDAVAYVRKEEWVLRAIMHTYHFFITSSKSPQGKAYIDTLLRGEYCHIHVTFLTKPGSVDGMAFKI